MIPCKILQNTDLSIVTESRSELPWAWGSGGTSSRGDGVRRVRKTGRRYYKGT